MARTKQFAPIKQITKQTARFEQKIPFTHRERPDNATTRLNAAFQDAMKEAGSNSGPVTYRDPDSILEPLVSSVC